MSLTEFSVPAGIELAYEESVPRLFFARVKRSPKATVMMRKSPYGGAWEPVSAADFAGQIIDLARAFIGIGLDPGDRIALMAPTSYTWTLIDYAAQTVGLVVVPIYETDAGAQVDWILEDTQARLVITETATQKRLVEETGRTVDKGVWVLQDGELDAIRGYGVTIPKAEVAQRLKDLNLDTLASIVYTSGSTGRPKGVMLTQRNFCFMTLTIDHMLPGITAAKDSRLLLFLPTAHVFARFAQYCFLSGNGVLGCVSSTQNLIEDIQAFKPSTLVVVPRVLEKVYNAASAKAGSGLKSQIFKWSAKVSEKTAARRLSGKRLGLRRRLRFALANKLVLSKIKELMGGNVNYVISGGAPLGERLGHFYHGLGLTVLEGYGLTETTGPATGNMPTALRIPSVGQPLCGVSVRLSEDGEVQVKGDLVMKGYYNNPQATAEALDEEGWFSTGDLGDLDDEGYLFITGRKKELIVTASGKNVAPAILEDGMRGHPLISNVVVIGDKRPYIAALVTLDREMLPTWLANHKLPAMDLAAAARHPAVQEALQRAAERASSVVSRAESIKKIQVLLGEFTVDNGLLTPSLKVRRGEVLKRYAREIDELYAAPKK